MARVTGRTGAKSAAGHDPAGDGALQSLLDTERQLTKQLEDAGVAADRVVAEARDAARELERAAEAGRRALVERLEQEERAALEEALVAVDEAARRDAARFDAVTDARITELADAVVGDFLGAAVLSSGERAR